MLSQSPSAGAISDDPHWTPPGSPPHDDRWSPPPPPSSSAPRLAPDADERSPDAAHPCERGQTHRLLTADNRVSGAYIKLKMK